MNSTNLYVTITRIITTSDPNDPETWQDLYRLVPYLRNSLCCVVCSNLLVDPISPTTAQCQHHMCKTCKGGRKKIKPACEGCKDCVTYSENRRLRILLQCYKKMCISFIKSELYQSISLQAAQPGTGFERGASNLLMLITEGAAFQDDYQSSGGLPKSTYSILPCIYTNSAPAQTVQQMQPNKDESVVLNSNMQNRNFYSVVYPGNGSKITLKRKPKEGPLTSNRQKDFPEKSVFKKPCTLKPKKGCRCGNATATPGKLTCCGQRCPCYVDSKACLECKCRGCRNPHRMDGQKVMPHIPELQPIQISSPTPPSPLLADIQSLGIEGNELESQFNVFERERIDPDYKTFKILDDYNVPLPLPTPPTDMLPLVFDGDDPVMSLM